MHQIIIDMICFKAFEFCIEILVKIFAGLDEIMRKFSGDIDFVPASYVFDYCSECFFYSRISICGIKIIDA